MATFEFIFFIDNGTTSLVPSHGFSFSQNSASCGQKKGYDIEGGGRVESRRHRRQGGGGYGDRTNLG